MGVSKGDTRSLDYGSFNISPPFPNLKLCRAEYQTLGEQWSAGIWWKVFLLLRGD